jgi:hypothetical protein
VSRIACVAVLVLVAAAGCGGGARSQRSVTRGVPRTLAVQWEGQASAVAAAAEAGNSCRAKQLATSLRDEVVAKKRRLPFRLRSPLVTSVTSLAARLKCTAPPAETTSTATKPLPPPKPPGHKHDKYGDHGHHGHGKGEGGDG